MATLGTETILCILVVKEAVALDKEEALQRCQDAPKAHSDSIHCKGFWWKKKTKETTTNPVQLLFNM